MPAATATRPAFDLKSTPWTLTALRLQVADAAALRQALDRRFADSGGLFDDEPLVVDLSPLCGSDAVLDWPALLGHLRAHGMWPIGAQGGSSAQMQAARAAGLAEVPLALRPAPAGPKSLPVPSAEAEAAPEAETAATPAAGPQVEPAVTPEPDPPPAAPEATRRPPLVVDTPLRSGQRVYARGGDLVILSVVSFGAEAIADGSIHVYGPLRGRAIAGALGDTTARIFSTCLEPQLVSIAGTYRTTEQPLPPEVLGRPAQVRLDGDRILVEPLAP